MFDPESQEAELQRRFAEKDLRLDALLMTFTLHLPGRDAGPSPQDVRLYSAKILEWITAKGLAFGKPRLALLRKALHRQPNLDFAMAVAEEMYGFWRPDVPPENLRRQAHLAPSFGRW